MSSVSAPVQVGVGITVVVVLVTFRNLLNNVQAAASEHNLQAMLVHVAKYTEGKVT